MLWAILNKSWRQNLTKQQLYGYLPPISKTIKIRRTRHAGHSWRSRDEFIGDVLLWTPSPGRARQDDQPAPTYHSSMPIHDVALKTYRKRWTIEKGGGRGSGISMLMEQHHDDDDDRSNITVCNNVLNVYKLHKKEIITDRLTVNQSSRILYCAISGSNKTTLKNALNVLDIYYWMNS